jgi:hypothetical protein
MNIYLQDLGHRRQQALLQWRVSALNRTSEGSLISVGRASSLRETTSSPGWLGRVWARGANIPPEVAAAGLEAMRGQTSGMTWGMAGGSLGFWMPAIGLAASGQHLIGALMAGIGAAMNGVGLWIPAYWLRHVCRPPVSVAEIEALNVAGQDDLEQAYLRLVVDAVRQGIAPEAAEGVRAALRAVGEAIEQLPAIAVPRMSVEALRAEAARASAEAASEKDSVVAASHERRADALERSATAAQRSEVLMRRAAALREEMKAQIESLRLGLVGFETASGDVSTLVSLADAVRTVAVESVSVADARTELEGSLSGPVTAEMPQVLRVGG